LHGHDPLIAGYARGEIKNPSAGRRVSIVGIESGFMRGISYPVNESKLPANACDVFGIGAGEPFAGGGVVIDDGFEAGEHGFGDGGAEFGFGGEEVIGELLHAGIISQIVNKQEFFIELPIEMIAEVSGHLI